jgi:hypothetical protein
VARLAASAFHPLRRPSAGSLESRPDSVKTACERGEFRMYLKRQLIIPERRQTRREAVGA